MNKKILLGIAFLSLVIGYLTGCDDTPIIHSVAPVRIDFQPGPDDNYPYDNYNAMHRHYYDDNA